MTGLLWAAQLRLKALFCYTPCQTSEAEPFCLLPLIANLKPEAIASNPTTLLFVGSSSILHRDIHRKRGFWVVWVDGARAVVKQRHPGSLAVVERALTATILK